MRITNKTRMYELLMSGRLGNYSQIWDTVPEVLASGYEGEISIRSRQISNPIRLYHVPVTELEATVSNLSPHQTAGGLTFCVAPPDHKRTIQGEVMLTVGGYYLFYSFAPLTMRAALETDGHHAYGLQAKMLLETYLEPVDFEDLQLLLETYDGAAIEFTGFRVPVGVIPHRKMLVWEVRHY